MLLMNNNVLIVVYLVILVLHNLVALIVIQDTFISKIIVFLNVLMMCGNIRKLVLVQLIVRIISMWRRWSVMLMVVEECLYIIMVTALTNAQLDIM